MPHDMHQKLISDIETIIGVAAKNGTLNRLKRVAIYFDEAELRTILRALHDAKLAVSQ